MSCGNRDNSGEGGNRCTRRKDPAVLTVLLQMNKEGQYLTLLRGGNPYKIDITIVDEYQNPVRGASVTLTFTNTVYGTGTSRSYTTDETGHITVTGEIDKSLVGSQRVSVTATKEKYNRGVCGDLHQCHKSGRHK